MIKLNGKCKICRNPATRRRGLASLCKSIDCEVALGLKLLSAKKKSAKIIENRQDKVRKEKLKSRADYTREAQTEFNKFIRMRDKLAGHPCISSGKPLDWNGNAVDSGHYRSRGSAPHLAFNENNCHAQSKHDNRYLSGNAVEYRIGLIARIGLQAVETLESDNTPRKYSISDLVAIKGLYRQKLKDIQKDD
jgi:hypothetical protein